MKHLKIKRAAIITASRQHLQTLVKTAVHPEIPLEGARSFRTGVEWAQRQHITVDPDDTGYQLIAKERISHPERGFDAKHDEQYKNNELTVMAILLAAEGTPLEPFVKGLPWPAAGYPDRRGKLDRVRGLTIAGALIAGAIDLEIAKTKKESEATA